MIKSMVKFVSFSIVILSLSTIANAAQVSLDGLSDQQMADMRAIIAQKAAENVGQNSGTKIADMKPEKMAEWGQQLSNASEGIAHAIGIAAREVGSSVNDFLLTPAGKITLAVILWKVFGTVLMHLLISILIITVAITVHIRTRNSILFNGYETIKKQIWFGLREVEVRVPIYKKADWHSDEYWLSFWSLVLVAASVIATVVLLINI